MLSDRFFLLPKIHVCLLSVPGSPVISNFDFHTEKISASFTLKLLRQKLSHTPSHTIF